MFHLEMKKKKIMKIELPVTKLNQIKISAVCFLFFLVINMLQSAVSHFKIFLNIRNTVNEDIPQDHGQVFDLTI